MPRPKPSGVTASAEIFRMASRSVTEHGSSNQSGCEASTVRARDAASPGVSAP
jgi:hypothetical protein